MRRSMRHRVAIVALSLAAVLVPQLPAAVHFTAGLGASTTVLMAGVIGSGPDPYIVVNGASA